MRNTYLQLCDYGSRFRILKGGKISLVVSAFIAGTTLLHAAPSGGVVTSGNASIVQSGAITNITQTTSKAAINWQNFSIGINETVNFNQPSVNAITLNRVVGNEKSIIDGAMNANGQVFLLNSNGVLFSKNASINTAGLVATTMNLSDADFMNGNYNFKGDSSASIINQGTINISDSGYAALFGKEVSNEGVIKATLGKVHLMGASELTLNLNGNSLVNLTVTQGVLDALVENKGAIIAQGGEVYLTTNAVNELLKGVVNNTGVIEAQTLDDVTGKIELYAHGGTTNVSGKLDADGGFIETSAEVLHVRQGTVVKAKTWLLDPTNITIGDGGAELLVGDPATTSTAGDVTIDADTIGTALSGGTSVLLDATNDITMNEGVYKNLGTEATLTFKAGRNIELNSNQQIVSTSDKLNLVFWADSDNNGEGAIYFTGNNILNTFGGHIWMGGGTAGVTWNGLAVGNGRANGVYIGSDSTILTYDVLATSDAAGDIRIFSKGWGDGGTISANGRLKKGIEIESGVNISGKDIIFDAITVQGDDGFGDPLLTNGGISISDSAISSRSISMSGTNLGSYAGVYIDNTTISADTDSGSISITGINNESDEGVKLDNAILNGDSVAITGGAVSDKAVYITGQTEIVANTININTTTNTYDNTNTLNIGVYLEDATIRGTTSVIISGNSQEVEGVYLTEGSNGLLITNNNTGFIKITGTSVGTDGYAALHSDAGVEIKAGNGAIVGQAGRTGLWMQGTTSSNGDGVKINGGNYSSRYGEVNIKGTSGTEAQAGNGIWIANATLGKDSFGSTNTYGVLLTGIATGGNAHGIKIGDANNAISTAINTKNTYGYVVMNGTGHGSGYGIWVDYVDANVFNVYAEGQTGLSITGIGGNTGGGVKLTGNFESYGALTITGNTGANATNGTAGVWLKKFGAYTDDYDYALTITGTATNATGNNHGVLLDNATINSAGDATIEGIGYGTGYGIYIRNESADTSSSVNSQDGLTTLIGHGKTGSGYNIYQLATNNEDISGTTYSGQFEIDGDMGSLINGGGGSVFLGNENNNFRYDPVSVLNTVNLSMADKQYGLYLGSIDTTGTIDIKTITGDIYLTDNITTTNASSTAITINAGQSLSTGGASVDHLENNIIVDSGTPTITAGAGGTIRLFTGNIDNSTDVETFATSNSYKKYESDESTVFSPALGAGTYVIYRIAGAGGETPVDPPPSTTALSYTLSPITQTYNGTDYSLSSFWSATSIFGASYSTWVLGTDYVFMYNGNSATSFKNAGTYSNITIDVLKSGYTEASSGNTAGSVTINKAPLTITANNASKAYDAQAYSGGNGVTYSGFVNNETASVLGGSLSYGGTSQGAITTGSYTIVPSGVSSGNYELSYLNGLLTINTSPSSGPTAEELAAIEAARIAAEAETARLAAIEAERLATEAEAARLAAIEAARLAAEAEAARLAAIEAERLAAEAEAARLAAIEAARLATETQAIINQVVNNAVIAPAFTRPTPSIPLFTFTQNGQSYQVFSSPPQGMATQVVSLQELKALLKTGGNGDMRIPLLEGSLIYLVNGGVRLPEGVEQEFFIALL